MSEMKIVYRLREKKTGEFLYIDTVAYGNEEESGIEHSLSTCGKFLYETDSIEKAEWVKHNTSPYYNAGIETPMHSYKSEELEIVKCEITVVETVVETEIPTQLQLLIKLAQKNEYYAVIIHQYMTKCEKNNIDMRYDKKYDYSSLVEHFGLEY